MKKLAVLGLMILGMFSIGKANAQKGLSVCIKVAQQLSWVAKSDDRDLPTYKSKAKFGTAFGLGAEYGITNNFGVGVDVLYSLEGSKIELTGQEVDRKTQYIKVPLYVSYNTDASKVSSFVAKAGPQVSFLTKSELNKIDTKEAYNKVTLGGAAYVGWQMRVSAKCYLTAGARFDYDFINTEDKDSFGYPNGRANTNNLNAGLEVGFKYRL